MRVICCGGRNYEDGARIREVLERCAPHNPTIVHGGARGADSIAAWTAEQLGLATEAHPADWDRHGKAAGPIRNQEMLDAGAYGVIAFPGDRGTADMVRRAEAAGLRVWKVDW